MSSTSLSVWPSPIGLAPQRQFAWVPQAPYVKPQGGNGSQDARSDKKYVRGQDRNRETTGGRGKYSRGTNPNDAKHLTIALTKILGGTERFGRTNIRPPWAEILGGTIPNEQPQRG